MSKTRTDKYNKAARLVGHGEQARSRAEKFGRALCKAIGLNPDNYAAHTDGVEDQKVLSRGPMKDIERFVDKADGKFNGNLHAVGDVTRYRIYFSDPSQILALRGLLAKTRGKKSEGFREVWEEEHGIKITEIDDYYLDPKSEGYIGFHVMCEVAMKKGPPAKVEFQFMHENMRLTDKLTHATHEQVRKIQELCKKEKRKPTEPEEQIMKGYNATNSNIYQADARNYGLDRLRRHIPRDKDHALTP